MGDVPPGWGYGRRSTGMGLWETFHRDGVMGDVPPGWGYGRRSTGTFLLEMHYDGGADAGPIE
ncbi:MAG: hypothetical protein EDM05_64140 [Leptolyngbya sp. IPPAS B-1204]